MKKSKQQFIITPVHDEGEGPMEEWCWGFQVENRPNAICEDHPLPNPGSEAAMNIGCRCPVSANAAGNKELVVAGTPEVGTFDYVIKQPTDWHIRLTCPVHGEPGVEPEAKPVRRWWQLWRRK